MILLFKIFGKKPEHDERGLLELEIKEPVDCLCEMCIRDRFGPMANVITSSSKRLINSSNQGKIQRVLVESENGKALFLDLGKVHLIVLMKNHANVGLIMVSSKRAAEKIIELTKDLEIVIEADEIPVKPQNTVTKAVKEEPLEPVRCV